MGDRPSGSSTFCRHCGAATAPDSAFCSSCGEALAVPATDAERDETQPDKLDPEPPRRKPARGLLLALGAVLIILTAGAVGFAVQYSSDTVTAHIWHEYGNPPVYFIVDGPTEENPGAQRLAEGWVNWETWTYPSIGKEFDFIDDKLVAARDIEITDDHSEHTHPYNFYSFRSRGTIEEDLGESGVLLPEANGAWEELEAYNYPTERLVIWYLDDEFYMTTTY
jgi:hypothetical protein